jgi:hypothetical protein
VRDLAILFLDLVATVARLAGPDGARSVVAESVLVKHQLLILNRSRQRSPKLHLSDRMIAGLCAPHPPGPTHPFCDRPQALNALASSSSADTTRKYRLPFSTKAPSKPGPKGPSQDLVAVVVDMKRRNPSWGCPRIAQQIALAFGIPINKDMVSSSDASRRSRSRSGRVWLSRAAAGSMVRRPRANDDRGQKSRARRVGAPHH